MDRKRTHPGGNNNNSGRNKDGSAIGKNSAAPPPVIAPQVGMNANPNDGINSADDGEDDDGGDGDPNEAPRVENNSIIRDGEEFSHFLVDSSEVWTAESGYISVRGGGVLNINIISNNTLSKFSQLEAKIRRFVHNSGRFDAFNTYNFKVCVISPMFFCF